MNRTGANGKLRILGIDPAAAGATGYGIVELCDRRCRVVDYGALRANRKAGTAERLEQIHTLVLELIARFTPHAVAVESPFSALNRRTAQRLAEVRGVVLEAVAESGLSVHSYSPREIKASVAGYGAADKQQMQQMVRATLELAEIPEPADAADALAVALCHLFTEQNRRRFLQGISGSDNTPIAAPNATVPRSRRLRARIQPLR